MSAPPSEVGGSEAGGSVVVDMKVQSSVEVDRKWLTGEFFQARLERWSPEGEEGQPHISLLLPVECDPPEGARLLKLRLESDYKRRMADPEASAEDRAWSCLDWWRATDGQSSALCTALFIFHFTMQREFAKEVAETLELYSFRCPKWAVKLADELACDASVLEAQSISEPIDIPFGSLKQLVVDAVKHPKKDLMGLVDRAIAGSDYSDNDLMVALVEAYFMLYDWKHEEEYEVLGQDETGLPNLGVFAGSESTWLWLVGAIGDLVKKNPSAACACHNAMMGRLARVPSSVTVRRKDRHGNTVATCEDYHLVVCYGAMSDLRAICSHSLFVKSSAEWKGMETAFSDFAKMGAPLGSYWFEDGAELEAEPFIDVSVLAVAHPEAQKIWLQALSDFEEFRDEVHLVHPGVRHIFLRNLSGLSDSDLAFLTSSDMPGAGKLLPLPRSSFRETLEAPQKKKQRQD